MSKGHRQSPILVRVSNVVSAVLFGAAAAAAAFIAGYSLAFSKVADVYAETSVLKAKARELEAEILHLRNYAVLIDAITTQGEAANELRGLPRFLPAAETPSQDTGEAQTQEEASPD
jgi:hypothetical protein